MTLYLRRLNVRVPVNVRSRWNNAENDSHSVIKFSIDLMSCRPFCSPWGSWIPWRGRWARVAVDISSLTEILSASGRQRWKRGDGKIRERDVCPCRHYGSPLAYSCLESVNERLLSYSWILNRRNALSLGRRRFGYRLDEEMLLARVYSATLITL